jgi:hypothetical protein
LQESARLNKILSSSPSLQKELALLQKTKLIPSAYTFEKKHLLKRTSATIIPIRRFILAASSAAAVLAIALFLVSREKSHSAQMASVAIPETHWRVGATPATPLNKSEVVTPAIDQMPNKNTPVKSVYQNYSEDTAQASDSTNNNQRTPRDLKMIHSHGTQPFDIAYHPAIVANTPEMKQVLQPISNPIANAKSEPITMFAYLSQKAVEKLENTYAYSFAEKQYEKISEKTKEDVVIEKNAKTGDENKAEELRIRIGGFEYKKNISEKSKSKNSTLNKLERLYHKINGQS